MCYYSTLAAENVFNCKYLELSRVIKNKIAVECREEKLKVDIFLQNVELATLKKNVLCCNSPSLIQV